MNTSPAAAIVRRNLTLDSLRAIAALTVLINHVLKKETSFLSPEVAGVLLFFLISGYCIVGSMNSLGQRPIREFLIRRFFRLYPVYWIAIAFVVGLTYFVKGLNYPKPIPLGEFFANLTMFQTALGIPDLYGVFWTLFIELIFYGIIVFLLLFRVAFRIETYILGCIVFTLGPWIAAHFARLVGFEIPYIPFRNTLFLSLFMLGGVTSMIYRE